MGTKNNPGAFDCYAALEPDEPYFILKSTDLLAPEIVRLWVACRRWDFFAAIGAFRDLVFTLASYDERKDGDKELEALRCADEMEAWKSERA